MILGIGTDLVDIRRIEQTIERHGDRFINRIYTETERARAERKANRIDTYAKRFAAKEACAKALGTGFRNGVFFRDMGVVNLPSGKPTLRLTGGALARSAGLEVHAGHGLDYATAETIAALPEIVELNIGYFMVGEALFVGLAQTVRDMRAAMDRGRAKIAT